MVQPQQRFSEKNIYLSCLAIPHSLPFLKKCKKTQAFVLNIVHIKQGLIALWILADSGMEIIMYTD